MQTEIRKASFGLVFLSGVALFVAFALIAWLWFRFTTKVDAYDADRDQARLKKLAEYRKAETDKLQAVSWVDQGKSVAKVPIDQAMRGVVPELKAKPVKASTVKVDEPYPYGLSAPKPAAPAAAPATKAQPESRPATVDSEAPAPQTNPVPKATPSPASSSTPANGPTPSPSGKAGLPAGESAAPTPSPASAEPAAPAPSHP